MILDSIPKPLALLLRFLSTLLVAVGIVSSSESRAAGWDTDSWISPTESLSLSTTGDYFAQTVPSCSTLVMNAGLRSTMLPRPFEISSTPYVVRMEAKLRDKFPGWQVSPLSEGGESHVYRVDRLGEPPLAVKFPRATHRYPLESYRNELRAYYSVNPSLRSNFVPILELDEEGPFLVMKFISGRTLTDYLHLFGPDADPLVVLHTMLKIARALKGLHDVGIAHVDLKPRNILIELGMGGLPQKIFLADLTMATEFNSSTSYFAEGSFGGTLHFLPRSARIGNSVVQPFWDLYALKVIFQALALGELPFLATDPTHLSSEYSFGREIKVLRLSPYTVLKESGMSPVVSAISFHEFYSVDEAIEALEFGIEAHSYDEIDRFFSEYFGPEILQNHSDAPQQIAGSNELRERLGTSLENSGLGFTDARRFRDVYNTYTTLESRR